MTEAERLEFIALTAAAQGVTKETAREWFNRPRFPKGGTQAEVTRWRDLNVRQGAPPTVGERQRRVSGPDPWDRICEASDRFHFAYEDLVGVVPDAELCEHMFQCAWCCLIRRPGVPRVDQAELRALLGQPSFPAIDTAADTDIEDGSID